MWTHNDLAMAFASGKEVTSILQQHYRSEKPSGGIAIDFDRFTQDCRTLQQTDIGQIMTWRLRSGLFSRIGGESEVALRIWVAVQPIFSRQQKIVSMSKRMGNMAREVIAEYLWNKMGERPFLMSHDELMRACCGKMMSFREFQDLFQAAPELFAHLRNWRDGVDFLDAITPLAPLQLEEIVSKVRPCLLKKNHPPVPSLVLLAHSALTGLQLLKSTSLPLPFFTSWNNNTWDDCRNCQKVFNLWSCRTMKRAEALAKSATVIESCQRPYRTGSLLFFWTLALTAFSDSESGTAYLERLEQKLLTLCRQCSHGGQAAHLAFTLLYTAESSWSAITTPDGEICGTEKSPRRRALHNRIYDDLLRGPTWARRLLAAESLALFQNTWRLPDFPNEEEKEEVADAIFLELFASGPMQALCLLEKRLRDQPHLVRTIAKILQTALNKNEDEEIAKQLIDILQLQEPHAVCAATLHGKINLLHHFYHDWTLTGMQQPGTAYPGFIHLSREERLAEKGKGYPRAFAWLRMIEPREVSWEVMRLLPPQLFS